jgi:hypothetical protein
MYLTEALKYDVPALHEDRLTQVVSATFNESQYFRRIFLKFLNVPYRPGILAKTQVRNEQAPSRPDLILFNWDFPYVLIESKVESKSDKNQQTRHSHLKAKYYVLIVRDPVQEIHIDNRFKKVTWYDFFSYLLEISKLEKSELDSFLINKLISFGRECGMLLPDRITKTDFTSACDLLSQIRLRNDPSHSFERVNPFQSLEVISNFLGRALIKVKDDPIIGHRIKSFTQRIKLKAATL